MPAPWSKQRIGQSRKELQTLYVVENKSIGEIASELGVGSTTIYDRLKRANIRILRKAKEHYNNQNKKVVVPTQWTPELAEFVGILLGDGHLTPTQVTVTLGTKESEYVDYVARLMYKLFRDNPRKYFSKRGDWTVYVGSTVLVRWFLRIGLASNKVKAQVGIPKKCFINNEFKKRVVRGLIDTDGSVYRLLSGNLQISLCNCSINLLRGAREILISLGFSPSKISANKIYLTKKQDIQKYYEKIGFGNSKHRRRYQQFTK